jgi:hypothetical protein
MPLDTPYSTNFVCDGASKCLHFIKLNEFHEDRLRINEQHRL